MLSEMLMPKFMRTAALLLLFSFQAQGSNLAEAHFLDRMIFHYIKTVEICEMIQKNGEDTAFKKLARKIKRGDKRALKQMRAWREGYYKSMPELWITDEGVDSLKVINKNEFDQKLLDIVRGRHKKVLQLLKYGNRTFKKEFLNEFTQDEIKDTKNELNSMLKIQGSSP